MLPFPPLSVSDNYPLLEHITNPVALGQRWLALTETKVHTQTHTHNNVILQCRTRSHLSLSPWLQLSAKHRSTGGVSLHQPPSVATTVIKNVKKGLSALSESHTRWQL